MSQVPLREDENSNIEITILSALINTLFKMDSKIEEVEEMILRLQKAVKLAQTRNVGPLIIVDLSNYFSARVHEVRPPCTLLGPCFDQA